MSIVLSNPRDEHGALGVSRAKNFPFLMKIIPSSGDKSDVFQVRYCAYHNDGHISTDPSGVFFDPWDDKHTTVQISASDGLKCVGTLRVSFSLTAQNALDLPCSRYYPEVRSLSLSGQRRLVEISRLAIDPTIINTSYRTTLYASLVRAALLAALAGNATDLLVATKPEWIRFYERMLGCTKLGTPAKYPPGDISITLLRVTMHEARARQRLQNRFFRITSSEIDSMRSVLKVAIGPALSLKLSPEAINV